MDLFVIITVLIVLSAAFSYLNERILKLPGAIGVVILSITVSILILIAGKTNNRIANTVVSLAESIDFSDVLLNVLLGFLLFASAIQFDYKKLREQRLPVVMLSTLSVVISAFVFGGLLYAITKVLHLNMPFVYCLIFGALISPTDPVAVGALLKKSKVPAKLQTIISGESLFNDGLGIILFLTFLGIAHPSGNSGSITGSIFHLFLEEVLGGITIGAVLGYAGYKFIKSTSDYQTKLLISLALVFGISITTRMFHASIPLATVTAGLIVGNGTRDDRHSGNDFLQKVWGLLDGLLNTILFILMGLQLVLMPFFIHHWVIGVLSIVIILIARFISVIAPAVSIIKKVHIGHFFILTWAGLRGGVSVAMALSLPESPYREIILSGCFFIVIFSIVVQGLTLNRVVNRPAASKD